MNTTAADQFLLLAEAARELGVTATALRKAASRRGFDARAQYELAEWTRLAQATNLI